MSNISMKKISDNVVELIDGCKCKGIGWINIGYDIPIWVPCNDCNKKRKKLKPKNIK